MKAYRRKLAILAISILLPFSAITSLSAKDAIKIGYGEALNWIDPHKFQGVVWQDLLSNVYESLIGKNQYGQAYLALAESVRVDDNAIFIKLRKSVTFHDGSDLVAKDVISSIKRAISIGSYSFLGKLQIEFDVNDDLDFVVRSEGDGEYLLFFIGRMAIIPNEYSNTELENSNVFPGTGAYLIHEFRRGEFLNLEKFEKYYDRNSFQTSDRVNIIHMDPDIAKHALAAGEIQYSYPGSFDRFRSSSILIDLPLVYKKIDGFPSIVRRGWAASKDAEIDHPKIKGPLFISTFPSGSTRKSCGDSTKCPEECRNTCEKDDDGNLCCNVTSSPFPPIRLQ